LTGGVANSGSSFTSRLGTVQGAARCDEEGADRADPDEEELDEDEYTASFQRRTRIRSSRFGTRVGSLTISGPLSTPTQEGRSMRHLDIHPN
jgi:vacuolar-type H+-ATPase catalytic subunit A/Vma1